MDQRKFQHLESFSSFIEFLTHPEAYRQTLEELKVAVAEWREVNEKARGIRDIDTWRAQVGAELDARQKSIDDQERAFLSAMDVKNAAVVAASQANDKTRAFLRDEEEKIARKQKELDAMLAQKADLARWDAELRDQAAALEKLDRELSAKVAKLSRIMEEPA